MACCIDGSIVHHRLTTKISREIVRSVKEVGLDRDNTRGSLMDDKGAAAVEEEEADEEEEDVDCYHGHQNTATKNKKCENKILQITSSTVVMMVIESKRYLSGIEYLSAETDGQQRHAMDVQQ